MKHETKPILNDQEVQQLKDAITSGYSNLQAIYATAVAEERFDHWYIHSGGAALVKRWRVMRTAPALRMFHEPTCHKEAESVLKRHPDTKRDYSDRTELSGPDGKELTPILVKFINGKDDRDTGRIQAAV